MLLFPIPKTLYTKWAQLCSGCLEPMGGMFRNISNVCPEPAIEMQHSLYMLWRKVELVLKYEANVGFGSVPLLCFSRAFHTTSFLCVSMSEWTQPLVLLNQQLRVMWRQSTHSP